MHAAKTMAGMGRNESCCRKSFLWHAQHLVNFGNVLQGWKRAVCQTLSVFHLARWKPQLHFSLQAHQFEHVFAKDAENCNLH